MTIKILAFILLAVGVAALTWGGISWTHDEKVVDLGPIEVKHEKKESIPLPPVLGVAALAVGGALLIASRSRA